MKYWGKANNAVYIQPQGVLFILYNQKDLLNRSLCQQHIMLPYSLTLVLLWAKFANTK